jgi:hypothetical protein
MNAVLQLLAAAAIVLSVHACVQTDARSPFTPHGEIR